jgi:hypothetical protein
MGFTNGDTASEELSPVQRIHILGQCIDINILYRTLSLANTTSSDHHATNHRAHLGKPWENAYTFSQSLPNLEETHELPNTNMHYSHEPTMADTPPIPIPWIPRFIL